MASNVSCNSVYVEQPEFITDLLGRLAQLFAAGDLSLHPPPVLLFELVPSLRLFALTL